MGRVEIVGAGERMPERSRAGYEDHLLLWIVVAPAGDVRDDPVEMVRVEGGLRRVPCGLIRCRRF